MMSKAFRDVSCGVITSNEGGSDVCTLDSQDLMSAESVGVYDEMYTSKKYLLTLSFDRIGPIA
jgi:hypothetical protein